MKISELDDKYKIFEIKTVSGDKYYLDGEKLNQILNSPLEYFRFPSGEGFRKTSISNWVIDVEKTRENVIKNKAKILESENTT